MTIIRVANRLADVRRKLGIPDATDSAALNQAIKLLKAALPFALPVRIVTGHLPPDSIAQEDTDQPYVDVLLQCYGDFLRNPEWNIDDDLTAFISFVRNVIAGNFSSFLEQQPDTTPLLLRRRLQTACDLCDEVMIRWLSITSYVRLHGLAILWKLRSLSSGTSQDVFKEHGLTIDTFLELPESEIVRLGLIERLAAEERQRNERLWQFLSGEPTCRDLTIIIFDTKAAYIGRNQ